MSAVGKVLQGFGPGLLSGIGNALQPDSKHTMIPDPPDPSKSSTAKPNTFKHGGVVQKTGVALVHKGETVIPASEPDDDDEDHDGRGMHNISLHRALSHLNKGGLHRALNVPEGKPIPQTKLSAAKNSKNPHVAKMAHFASTMEGWHKK